MICWDLFSGRESFAQVARALGHEVVTVEKYPEAGFSPDFDDVMTFPPGRLPQPDVIWASPPCQGFSIAAVSHHWTMHEDGSRSPKSDTARLGLTLLNRTLDIIRAHKPRYYFIENPRGVMRKIIAPLPGMLRRTVTYCQYGDTRMKPTDIWTNCEIWTPRAMCRNGDPCHEAAPRGSKTGTQGLKGAAARSQVPLEVAYEILTAIE